MATSFKHRGAGWSRWAARIAALSFLFSATGRAQTDEIQVYNAEIAAPGELTLTFHNNFTPIGRKVPAFAGGIVPDRTLNGVTEWGYGITRWWELGAYVPALYSLDGSGRLWFDGAKLRSLFVSPDGATRRFYYGCNLELSYNRPQWAPSTWQLEVRPIIGIHLGAWDLTANPIVDVVFEGSRPVFAPAFHVLRRLSQTWTAGLELYEDFGGIGKWAVWRDEQQTLFATALYTAPRISIEFGIGAGLPRSGSDPLVIKLIVSPRLFGEN